MSEDPHIEIVLSNEQAVPVDEARLVETARRTARAEGAWGTVSVVLVGAEDMAELNHRWMGESGATDVLAFPIDGCLPAARGGPPPMVGEVVICPEVSREGPSCGGQQLDSELDLLVAHGVLHLLGHHHDDEAAAAVMRDREEAATGRSGAQAP
ncbi:MAG: rRNA maturation RNase YbeY [Actinomycetota bacterium]